jgi:hypothetical protein
LFAKHIKNFVGQDEYMEDGSLEFERKQDD